MGPCDGAEGSRRIASALSLPASTALRKESTEPHQGRLGPLLWLLRQRRHHRRDDGEDGWRSESDPRWDAPFLDIGRRYVPSAEAATLGCWEIGGWRLALSIFCERVRRIAVRARGAKPATNPESCAHSHTRRVGASAWA
jgi:hypothetical protein